MFKFDIVKHSKTEQHYPYRFRTDHFRVRTTWNFSCVIEVARRFGHSFRQFL